MDPAMFLTLPLILLSFFFLLVKFKRPSKKLPPGSFGLPIIGQSFSFLNVIRSGTLENWLRERVKLYGPVSKMSIVGTPTVFIHGVSANKFGYTNNDGKLLNNKMPTSVRSILGERNIMELSGDDHKRVRGALMSFLKADALKRYVGKMDEEIQLHLQMHWHGNNTVKAGPLMNNLTFNMICTLLFGMERGERRNTLLELFMQTMGGIMAVPVNLPFTCYNRSLRAAAKIRSILRELISEKRIELQQNTASSSQDLITCMLSIQTEQDSISDEEIVDTVLTAMVGGYDTTSILLTSLINRLTSDSTIYNAVLQEQEEIAKSKGPGEHLAWEDLAKMKYTWRVTMETLRMSPPVAFAFRKVLTDFEYEGYLIPKGWQILLAPCMTQMDGKIYPQPSKFDPSRFQEQRVAPPFSFVAFGGGPRMCAGNEFARIETLTTLHYLLTFYKLSREDKSVSFNPLSIFHDRLPLQIQAKKSVHVH